MDNTLAIQPITDKDVEQVIQQWHLCGLTRPWNDPLKDIIFARQNTNSEILLGWKGITLAATAMVGHDGHRGYAYYVSVHPDFQNMGYGQAIMEAAEHWLQEKGVWKINLLVREDNLDVIQFYERLGYTAGKTVQLGKALPEK